jgi:hypothetical protein
MVTAPCLPVKPGKHLLEVSGQTNVVPLHNEVGISKAQYIPVLVGILRIDSTFGCSYTAV